MSAFDDQYPLDPAERGFSFDLAKLFRAAAATVAPDSQVD